MIAGFSIGWVLLFLCGIFALRQVVPAIKRRLHPNPILDRNIKYQGLQLIMAVFFLLGVDVTTPGRLPAFLRVGDLSARIEPIAWLGVTGQESWLEIALTIGLFISLGTGIFMWLRLRKANVRLPDLGKVFAWAILFSIANAFSEEAIFRLGWIVPFHWIWSTGTIALVSGIVFGLPHWFGMPNGPVGAIMAGFMGWLLALSVLQTGGIGIAWGIHFVQDVIIISSMLAIDAAPKADESFAWLRPGA